MIQIRKCSASRSLVLACPRWHLRRDGNVCQSHNMKANQKEFTSSRIPNLHKANAPHLTKRLSSKTRQPEAILSRNQEAAGLGTSLAELLDPIGKRLAHFGMSWFGHLGG